MNKETTPVRLKESIVEKVRKNKKKTGISVSAFFEIAAEEKLSRDKLSGTVKSGFIATNPK